MHSPWYCYITKDRNSVQKDQKELVSKDGGQIVITNGRIVGFSGDFGLRINQSFHTMGYLITRKAPVISSSPAPDMQYQSSPSPVV